jgi:hypothetical protein
VIMVIVIGHIDHCSAPSQVIVNQPDPGYHQTPYDLRCKTDKRVSEMISFSIRALEAKKGRKIMSRKPPASFVYAQYAYGTGLAKICQKSHLQLIPGQERFVGNSKFFCEDYDQKFCSLTALKAHPRSKGTKDFLCY